MRKVPQFLLRSLVVALMPVAANAAGTYYTGGYQSPQAARSYARTTGGYTQYSTYNRTAGYTNGGYNNARSGYANATARNAQPVQQNQQQAKNNTKMTTNKSGFFIGADIAREYAMWQFDMNLGGSILHYDNIAWNTLNLNGGYVFDLGSTKLQIDAGLKYGFQSGKSTMVDDDITRGGYWIADIVNGTDGKTIVGQQIGHALSVGTTSGGNMLGFNVGFGMTDVFSLGSVKFTPSIGYRYFKYKMKTSSNYGVAVDTAACFVTEDGETQCDPIVVFIDSEGNPSLVWRDNIKQMPSVPSGSDYYETEGTFYYEEPGTSHSYEATWAGPYVALDLDYDINQKNVVNGRVEIGLPGYTSVGDQPYRFDWAHPKSVEDKAGMFSAMHFGLGANWKTAISNTVMLTIGVSYDYYTVSNADATTWLNEKYYTDLYQDLQDKWLENHENLDKFLDKTEGNQQAIAIENLKSDCPGWVCKTAGEVNSFYRSLGVHVGVSAKF